MNVLIVDDHIEILEGIKNRVLRVFPDAKCFEVTSFKGALFMFRCHEITLMLSDLQFKNETEQDGWKLLSKALVICPNVKAIAYTGHGSYNVMNESLEIGFHSFLEKGCSFEEFKNTLENVCEKGKFESSTIQNLKRKRYAIISHKFRDSLDTMRQLTNRELEVALLLPQTINTGLIAQTISTENKTVQASSIETYIKRIMVKLSIDNRRDLALFCNEFKGELKKLI